MVRSMTGYGKYEAENGDARLTVEIKSVNHRYCDISIRLPKNLNAFENDIRRQIKKSVSRGKIDVYITYEAVGSAAADITYNKELAGAYMELLARMASDFQIANDMDAFTLSKYPEVFTVKETTCDEDKLKELLETAVSGALKEFIRAREAEGEELKADLLNKLADLQKAADDITGRSPLVFEEYKERLRAKVTELLGDTKPDESVLATELVIYADKICVDEELVRMNSHIKHMKETLEHEEAAGRKLDFIAQELNREANTTLSKANDQVIADQGILLKTEIEKIREQIQNLE